jgi:hypothetical protein
MISAVLIPTTSPREDTSGPPELPGLSAADQRLGRTGEEIDANAAEQLPFRLSDVGVARADDHVDCGNALGERQAGAGSIISSNPPCVKGIGK